MSETMNIMCDHESCLLRKVCGRHKESGTVVEANQVWGKYTPVFVGLSDHEPDHPGIECDGYIPKDLKNGRE